MNIRIITLLLALAMAFTMISCGDDTLTYEEYWAMSGKEQAEYYNSFDSAEDFFEWYNAAKAKYDADHPDIDVGDGELDLGELGK
jgi:hypothetical protein